MALGSRHTDCNPMGIVLIVLAVWCALSVLVAAVHYVWHPFAEPPCLRVQVVLRPTLDPFVSDPYEFESEGFEVSDFFRSYAQP